jgi:hypothetical protein
MSICEPQRCIKKSVYQGISVLLTATCALILSLWPTGEIRAENGATGAKALKVLRFAALRCIYYPHISPQDANTAIEMIIQKRAINKSYPYLINFQCIDQENDKAGIIQRDGYHFVILSGPDYFTYRKALHLEPILIPSKTDQPTENLVFLTKKDKTLSAISRRKERTLLIESGLIGNLSIVWINTLLPVHGLPASDQFFTSIRRVEKPVRAVLPVFFDRADACIITQNTLDVINELNPQIGQQLKALFRSEGLISAVICATQKATPTDIKIIKEEGLKTPLSIEVRQTMTIAQLKRFIEVTPNFFKDTEKLLKSHEQLYDKQRHE